MEFNVFYEMGHSWLEAKLKDVFNFNIQDEISSQSRIEGPKVFLDIDFDAKSFLKRMRDRYPTTKFRIKENVNSFKGISEKERYNKILAERKLELFR